MVSSVLRPPPTAVAAQQTPFLEHDHSTSVLIVFAISALAALAGLLFLAGEVFIGHD